MNMHSEDLDLTKMTCERYLVLTKITCERFNLFILKKNIFYFFIFYVIYLILKYVEVLIMDIGTCYEMHETLI